MTNIPLVALIGLPNSGKSTLLNKITGNKHTAVVASEAHTTRDLNFGEDFWEGMYVRFVDTGGLVPDADDKIKKMVQVKSWSAIVSSDLLVWVIDRKQSPETISLQIIQKVWKTGKPFIIAINKVDDPNLDADVADYAFLGGSDFVNVSCNTGYGLNTLMDSITDKLQIMGFEKITEIPAEFLQDKKFKRDRTKKIVKKQDHYEIIRHQDGLYEAVNLNGDEHLEAKTDWDVDIDLNLDNNLSPKIPKILFLGKPNVGKSSLFNAMVGKDIQIITEIAGTTLSVNEILVERQVEIEEENDLEIETLELDKIDQNLINLED
jgi:GTPase